MEIYLPIAQMSVHWLVLLGLGGGIGFLSGLLGVGGAFLLTPLLIFAGVPSAVAVATTSSHVTASSMSGALAQWRKGAIDLKMAQANIGDLAFLEKAVADHIARPLMLGLGKQSDRRIDMG